MARVFSAYPIIRHGSVFVSTVFLLPLFVVPSFLVIVSLRARRSEIRDIGFVSVPSLIGCDTIQDRTWTEVLYGDYGAENLRPPLHV